MYMASIVTSSVYGLGYDSIHIEWLGRPLLPKIYLECTSQVAQNTSAKTTLFIPFSIMQLIFAAYWTITNFLSSIINLFLMQFIPPANANFKGFCTCGFEKCRHALTNKKPLIPKGCVSARKMLAFKENFLEFVLLFFQSFSKLILQFRQSLDGYFSNIGDQTIFLDSVHPR